jgi:hypothetical protein
MEEEQPENALASSTVSKLEWIGLSHQKGPKVILSDVSGSLEAGETLAGSFLPFRVTLTILKKDQS